jgi:tetratricopeptide (TPR) repeat protein
MIGAILTSLMVLAAAQQSVPTTVQKTSGWCSPNIANVVGSVTVNCIGVDPRALKKLNEQLSEMKLDRDKAVQVADEWTKRYKELEAQLSAAGDDSVLSRQAEEYLHEGELEKAEAILRKLVNSGEQHVDSAALNNYRLALDLELQFRASDALPYLKNAYQYRPENVTYGLEYSAVLLEQNDYKHAEPALLTLLDTARRLAEKDPDAHLLDLALTLNDLALLYTDTQRLKEADASYQEALKIRRNLSQADPASNLPGLAKLLNNVAILYAQTQRIKEAEAAQQEALKIFRQLAGTNPDVYLPNVATSLNNLGSLYSSSERFKEAEVAYLGGLDIRRQLARTNPPAYQQYVASSLTNLGDLYSKTRRMELAEQAYQQALAIYRELAKANPGAYQPDLAKSLSNLASLNGVCDIEVEVKRRGVPPSSPQSGR